VPQRVTKLRIFAASPGDVTEERIRLKEVVDELNVMLAHENLVLELVRWETHTWPGFGADAQAVINSQLEPYDIFLGIMWGRLGTPTGRSLSGTVEEFEQAYDLWRTHGRPMIMFYFNTAAPQSKDIEQVRAVAAFREILETKKGSFYWRYTGADEFERDVRLHLYQQVLALVQTAPPAGAAAETLGAQPAIAPRLQDEPSGVQAKLAAAAFLAPDEGVAALVNAETQVRTPGFVQPGVSMPTLIVVTNRRILWWFLPAPGRLRDPQSTWSLAYEQIAKVRYSRTRTDPFGPKLRITHKVPTEPKTILSFKLQPRANADAIASYIRSRVD
jgi:hypothetical protein